MASYSTVGDIWRDIRRSWLVLFAVTAAFIGLSIGAYVMTPEKYTAEAQHTVEPINILTSGSSFDTVNMETERIVATSTSVLERASESLEGPSVRALRSATTVQVPRNSHVLQFEVTTSSPESSAEWANAIAAAYGEERSATAEALVQEVVGSIDESVAELHRAQNGMSRDGADWASTQAQIDSLMDQRTRLSAGPYFPGQLVTVAVPPLSSDRPPIYVYAAAGVFLGILLGSVAALAVTRARSKSRSNPSSPPESEPTATPESAPQATPESESLATPAPASPSAATPKQSPKTAPRQSPKSTLKQTAQPTLKQTSKPTSKRAPKQWPKSAR